MTIKLYLNNIEETEIACFHDIKSNPFKLEDIVTLDVADIQPRIRDLFTRRGWDISDLETKRKMFRLKSIKLVKELKFLHIGLGEPDKIDIDYYCEFVEEKLPHPLDESTKALMQLGAQINKD